METSDNALAVLAAKGDGEAYRSLLQRHYAAIYRVSYRVLGSREDAEDLAQDVCAALPRKLRGFEGRARFSTWLHQIVINAARDQIRRNQSTRNKARGWGEVEVLRRGETTQRHDELHWLSSTMNAMPQDLRETVALVLGEEMNHAQAAGVLGLSEGTVSWRMGEVRKFLRAQAKQEEMLG